MNTEKVKKAIEKILEGKGSKKFIQTVDLIITLKDLDLKKNDQQLDLFVNLPHSKGKPNKICGLVGPELASEAKAQLDLSIEDHDFDAYKNDAKKAKKLTEEYDFFVAQATVMPKIATVFGRTLGARGKMPNPKAGCVVSPKASLGPLKERLMSTVRVTAKTSPVIQVPVGSESQDVKEIAENISTVYNSIVSHTVQGENNVKGIMIKLTMGKPERVE